MRAAIVGGVTAFFGLASGCSTGGEAPKSTPGSESAPVQQLALELATIDELPKCDGDNAGLTAYVEKPGGMYRCDGKEWMEIPCKAPAAGDVAYGSVNGKLFACVSEQWTVIGPMGDPCPPGVNTLVLVYAEPPGPNCAIGGQRVDVGHDLNANAILDPGEITQTTYVCKEPVPQACGLGLTLCGTACVDLATSATNCGSCGRSCGGDSCSAGACQVTTLALRTGDNRSVAVNGNYAFFVNAQTGRAIRVPKAGGAAVETTVGASPSGVAVGSGRLFVANTGSNTVTVLTPSTMAVVTTLPVGTAPTAVAIGGNFAYVTNSGANTLSIINTSTLAVTTTGDAGTKPFAITADSTGAWWVANVSNWLVERTVSGGTNVPVYFTQWFPQGIAIGGNGYMYVTAATTPTTGTIHRYRIPAASGGEVPVVTGQKTPRGITVDGDWVYWVNEGDEVDSVRKVPRIGGTPITLAPAWHSPALATDATHVYFVDMEGLKRVAK
jgi:YVTN family beta-propeller protein